jgi:hypothetical protein
MPYPDFTDDERYLIASARYSPQMVGSPTTWGYLIPSCILFTYAVYNQSFNAMIAAFLVIGAFRLWDIAYEHRWSKVWGSIIRKYDAALAMNEATPANKTYPES